VAKRYLLDSNLLIGAFDGEAGNEAHAAAKEKVIALLKDPEVRLALTPLIRYEVLRGCRGSVDELDARLNDFEEFDVSGLDARRAAEIFREAKVAGTPLNKMEFDVFHWVCAEHNKLELLSADGDISKIKALIAKSVAGPSTTDAA
jgi:predicted nucleic acid-binding protein